MLSFLSKLKYITTLLPYKKGKIEFFKIQIYIIISSILELVSLSLIFPYLNIVTSFQNFEDNYDKGNYIYKTYELLSLDKNLFLIFLGLLLVFTFSFSSLGNLFVKYKIVNFSQNYTAFISTKIFKKILNSKFEFFLNHSYSEIQRVINDEINRLVSGVILPSMLIFSKILIILTIITLLLLKNFLLTIFLIFSVLVFYIVFFYLFKSKVSRYGKELTVLGAKKIKFIHESTNLIKEIKIYNKGDYFISFFEKVVEKIAKIYSFVHIASIIPRSFIDILIFSFGIFFILYIFNFTDSSVSTNIALIGFYAIAAFRIIPAYQEIYNSLILIKNNEVSHELIDKLYNYGNIEKQILQNKKPNFPNIYNKIILNINKFVYNSEDGEKLIFENTSINLKRGKKIALIGQNGSGKSTLINLIMGLLSSNEISYYIDDKIIDRSVYQKIINDIAYIPQNVVLFNESIRKNITLSEVYDQKLLDDSIEFSDVSSFIDEQFKGSDTIVSERQLSLSGGQAQKVGIARAVYHQRPIIICDEPFTYLDEKSEHITLEKILKMENKTVIIITHKLNSLDYFDCIYEIKNNKINLIR